MSVISKWADISYLFGAVVPGQDGVGSRKEMRGKSAYLRNLCTTADVSPLLVNMATIAEQIQVLPIIVRDVRITNCVTLAAFVILLYDIIITFPSELELVWKAKWTTGNMLFIMNRYPVLSISLFLLFYMFYFQAPYNLCVVSNYVEAWSMLVFIIPVQILLILRTQALWEHNRVISIILYSVLVACDITIIVSMALLSKSITFENRPIARPVLGCFGIMNELSTSDAIPSWSALIIFDTTVFVLTLIRVDKIRRGKRNKSLLTLILFRDGIVFYVIMLASSVANLIMYASLPRKRRGLIVALVPLLRAVMSVCTARLILNLRSVAVNRGRSRNNWAFGDLDMPADASNHSRATTATAVGSPPSSKVKFSFGATNSPPGVSHRSADTEIEMDIMPLSPRDELGPKHDSDIIVVSHPTSLDVPRLDFGSERSRHVTPVPSPRNFDRDTGEYSQPSSFRISLLNQFTNIVSQNMGDAEQ